MATQVVDLTKLPFVKSLLASMTPGPDISQEFQHSGPNAALQTPTGSPAPPDMQQQDALPAPDLSVGQPPPVPQQPANPVQDLTQSMVQDQTAPNLRTAMYTANAGAAPTPTKANRLLQILRGGLTGGAAGAGQRTFGQGFQQAQVLPLEVNKMGLQNEQIRQLLPFLRAQNIAGLQKTASEAQKNVAEAGKAQAEVEGMPIRQALERAQTEAAYYKDDPNLGLIDVRTGQPINPAGMAPLSPEEAQALGKQPGERVPLKLKNTANEIVNRGIRSVAANGRQLLVDNKGNTIKDMGQATPMAVINAQMAGPGTTPTGALSDPNMEKVAQAVAAGQEDMATALRPYIRFPGKANALEARALQINPNYYQGDYQNRLKVLEKATAGSWADQKVAFNTAMQHADLLDQAAKALNNGDVRTLAGLKNKLSTEFGDADYTNFQAISHAYVNEIQKMLSAGHITDAEISQNAASMPANANYSTIHKVMSSYKNLAQSKLNVLNKQIKSGMKGSQGLNDNVPEGAQHVIQIGNQHYQYKGTGATDDLRNYEPIQQ